MKIQCSCGAKYEFAITPVMVNNPVRFVCPVCGLDASDFVDSLVRRELGQTASPPGVPQMVTAVPTLPPGSQPAPVAPLLTAAPAPVRLAVPVAGPAAAHAPGAEAANAQAEYPPCPKHPGQLAMEKCYICSKPICPKCMELFGYVCSPLCRAKADARGIAIPVFAGQKSVVEARRWRKIGLIAACGAGVLAAVFGLWFWYAWFGSVPRPVFAVRFSEMAYSGQSFICGKDQIVFLHGGTLARHDMKQKKAVWSRELLDAKQLDDQAAALLKQLEENYARTSAGSFKLRPPTLEKLRQRVEREAAAALELYVSDRNVWVASSGKLVRYDWETGNPSKELPLRSGFGRLTLHSNELVAVNFGYGETTLTHINMNTCDVQTEDPSRPAAAAVAQGGNAANAPGGGAGGSSEMAGLPTVPGKDAGKALDPAKVAEQAQRLSYPARIALPATLAATMNQERALSEMESDEDRAANTPGARKATAPEQSTVIPGPNGFVQLSTRLLESRITERSAMKAAPKKSALDNLSVANTADAANEILNEMQRNRGGDIVREDESRYLVTIRRPGQSGSWSGEVVGPPSLYPLQTVNVLTANKSMVVLDKSNKKLWQSSLSFNVPRGPGALLTGDASAGQGPCVEHGNTLYVFDEGVLAAFDLATGNARWRLPSIGITGLFFDDQDMLYVNSSTAGPENLKYSRQIDITQKSKDVVLKVDAKDGRVLWSAEPGGPINYLSGKFLYTVSFYQPEESDEDNPYAPESNRAPFLRIRRISPRNGHILWEHGQERAPLDIQFDKNTIRLVFKKEVQVLRFLTF
jgi:hypothetical protein